MDYSWIDFVLDIVVLTFWWIVVPILTFTVMGSAFLAAFGWLVEGVRRIRRRQPEGWVLLGLSIVATTVGVALAALLCAGLLAVLGSSK